MSLNKAPKNAVFYRDQNWHYPKITHGKGVFLYDDTGKSYLDGCSGSSVANIGHGNEEVADYTAAQIKKIAFSHLSRFTTDAIEECSARIAEITPGDLNHLYFVSGGSEATEAAIKMARQYFVERDKKTAKWRVISRWPSFHGNTLGSLAMTGITGRRKIYDPLLLDFPKINQAYCYRCPYKSTYPQCGLACAYELETLITRTGAENVMAFIAEPVVGSAAPGVHPPKEYFKVIREICTKYDVLLIIDEVMSGFGRTGKAFGIDYYDIVPDILTIAKGMSCGYTPIGAAVANDAVFDEIMIKGTGHFVHGHTYGGNPLSAAIACCVMEITKREKYFENAAVQGERFMKKLQKLYDYPIVGDIRGKGLMIGIEFVQDKKTKAPFDPKFKVRDVFTQHCLDEGLVVYPGGAAIDGIRGDHVLLAPPISISASELDLMYDRLEAGIKRTVTSLKV